MDRFVDDFVFALLTIFIFALLFVFIICTANEHRSNDEEIVRCVEKQNYNFRVKGGVVTCLDGSEQ